MGKLKSTYVGELIPGASLHESTHILEAKVKRSTVTHGTVVQWPSGNIEKVRDFAHLYMDRRMAEELKLDKWTDSFWNKTCTGAKLLYDFWYAF